MSFACSSPAGGMLFGVSGLLLLLLLELETAECIDAGVCTHKIIVIIMMIMMIMLLLIIIAIIIPLVVIAIRGRSLLDGLVELGCIML